MNNRWCVAALVAVCAFSVFAEDEETPKTKETIVVRAKDVPRKTDGSNDVQALPAATAVLDRKQIEEKTTREPGEMLRALPGVAFVYYGQGGIPSGPSVRGYTDRNFGQDIATSLDGVPLNLPGFVASHGAVDLTMLLPESIERVDLVRGPLNVRAGDFNRGASIDFITREDFPTRPSVSLSGGSLGTRRALLTWGNGKNIYTNIDAGHTDGYGNNQDLDHLRTFTKARFRLGTNDLTLSALTYNSDWNAGGYLDVTQVRSGTVDEKAAVNRTDGGELGMWLASLRFRHAADTSHPFIATAHVTGRDWQRFRHDTLLGPTQSQVLQQDQRLVYGLRAEQHFALNLAGRPLAFLAGTSVNRDDVETRQWRTTNGVIAGANDDVDELITTAGVYAQAQWTFAAKWKLLAGARYASVDYDIHDNIRAAGSYVDSYSASKLNPKVGLAFSPLPVLDLFANFATGMRSPAPRTEVRNSISSVDRVEIAETKSYEAGFVTRPLARFTFGGTVWRADNTNEVRGIPPGGTQFESLGKSRREGAEAEVNFYPTAASRVYAALAWVDAELLTPTAAGATHLPDIPSHVHQIGFEHQFRGVLRLAGELAFYGSKDLNTLGTIRSDSYQRLTLKAIYEADPRYRIWLGGFAYPDSVYDESMYLFGSRVGTRPNPRQSVEAGFTYVF